MRIVRSLLPVTLALILGLGAAACSSETDDTTGPEGGVEDEGDTVVFPGKEDNFFSLSAQEYILQGPVRIVIEDEYAGKSDEEKLARVRELIPLKSLQVGWFLNVYLVKKDDDAANAGYGGYHALVREGSYKSSDVVPDPENELAFTYTLEFEIGGEMDLLDDMPLEHVRDDVYSFRLAMAKVSNSRLDDLDIDREWYRSYGSWTPDGKDEDKVEYVELTIRPEDRSKDAYFDYGRLIEDGKITVGLHFGWDYHKDYHLLHSESVYDKLVSMGYDSPVESYDKYVPGGEDHSGPLTKVITAAGQEVTVEISMFWGKPDTVTDPDTDAGGLVLENDMMESFADREIIIFSGHSGPFYGFALANWRKTSFGDIDDSEVPDLEMPEDVYQVVLAEGCDTYGLGEAFWHNPAKKDHHDLDVITTTAPSNASTPSTVMDFLNAMVGTNRDDELEPMRISELLKDLDSNSYWFHTMYGVHGIDDNPHVHPFANDEALCGGCVDTDECGGLGNRCVALGRGGAKVCTYECIADDGCPEGYGCERIATGGYMQSAFVCVPRSQSCGVQKGAEHGEIEESGTVAKREERHFEAVLSAGLPRLQVLMNGNGDADLYVRFGAQPTLEDYDCRPYSSGSDEECSFDDPKPGTWYIMVAGYANSSDFDLLATW